MRRDFWLVGIFLVLGLTQCNESTSSAVDPDVDPALAEQGQTKDPEITPLKPTKSATDPLSAYEVSNFSKYVYLKKDGKTWLVDFNFFPSGTDFQKDAATFPCAEPELPEGVDASLGAPTDGSISCNDTLKVDLSKATITFLGLEFPFESPLKTFEKDFGFFITPEGFIDAESGDAIVIAPEDGTLVNVSEVVVTAQR